MLHPFWVLLLCCKFLCSNKANLTDGEGIKTVIMVCEVLLKSIKDVISKLIYEIHLSSVLEKAGISVHPDG